MWEFLVIDILNHMNLSSSIEAVLFYKAEPVALKKLAELLHVEQVAVISALDELETRLSGRGLALVRTTDDVMLGTAKEYSSLIEEITKDDLSRDLGKAGLETLAIVLYQGPVGRADIDYIRGVNSQFILRALLVRGLVERVDNPSDARSFLYKPSIDLLAHLGLSKIEDLPEFVAIKKDIEGWKSHKEESQPVV